MLPFPLVYGCFLGHRQGMSSDRSSHGTITERPREDGWNWYRADKSRAREEASLPRKPNLQLEASWSVLIRATVIVFITVLSRYKLRKDNSPHCAFPASPILFAGFDARWLHEAGEARGVRILTVRWGSLQLTHDSSDAVANSKLPIVTFCWQPSRSVAFFMALFSQKSKKKYFLDQNATIMAVRPSLCLSRMCDSWLFDA